MRISFIESELKDYSKNLEDVVEIYINYIINRKIVKLNIINFMLNINNCKVLSVGIDHVFIGKDFM